MRTSDDVGWVVLYVHRNRRLIRDGSPGRPPRFSHSSWTLTDVPLVEDQDHFALRPQKRGCLLRTGTGGGGGGLGKRAREWRLDRGYRPKKTGETVVRRKNNGSVKAVSPRHCAATSAPRSCCINCRAGQSQGQCPLHCCWRTTRSERRPTFAAQLHLPAHDLFWANLRVQLHLPPLDLAWNPVFIRMPGERRP